LAGLVADDFLGEPVAPDDSDFARATKLRGLQSLALIDEIALVAIPDILIQPDPDPDYRAVPAPPANPCVPCPPPAPPRAAHQPRPAGELPPVFSLDDIARVQAALIESCEDLGDRVALLALPFTLATSAAISREDIIAWRNRFDSRVGALYAPWVEVAEPRGTTTTRLVPPCGHVAGAIAEVDLTEGVQRAPANVDIFGVVRVARPVDDELHGVLNESNVNALRIDFGVGCRVGGARSLALEDQWRYLNVVRLMLTIKKAADIALRWTVFEPNDEALWTSVRATLTAILQLFFDRGAFDGDTPEEAFYVRCDETTNPPDLREEGQLVALLGFQPAAPCEFIVLRVGRQSSTPAVSLFAAEEIAA
ncbi:MAG TPA: phage tail sheath subtilisin-like domain-containing protein, partial [Rhodanobacteraceae bacterium]|nr:phage tail sheath subtilisin-like domain-containing protein [Rhodanobacteraceae bacterium]